MMKVFFFSAGCFRSVPWRERESSRRGRRRRRSLSTNYEATATAIQFSLGMMIQSFFSLRDKEAASNVFATSYLRVFYSALNYFFPIRRE